MENLAKITKNKILENLKKQIELIIDSFNFLLLSIKKSDLEDLNKVFSIKDDVEKELSIIYSEIIEWFTHAPLGKDLRRNVSYLQITKSLKHVYGNCTQLANYTHSAIRRKYKTDWIVKISEIVIKRLRNLLIILETEDETKVLSLVRKNQKIKDFYSYLYKHGLENERFRDFSIKERNEFVKNFFIAARNVNDLSREMKEIVNSINFIVEGKLH